MFSRMLRILVVPAALVFVAPAAPGQHYADLPYPPGVDELPEATADAITGQIGSFYWSMHELLREEPELLRLVDRDHGLGRNYEPEDLVSLSEAKPHIETAGEQLVTQRTAEALSDMVESAREDGVDLVVASAYRSYERQETLHAHWVDELGEELAQALSAPAGHSQHQLGTTVDFAPVGRAFEDTPADRWLRDNAWRYGFSLSYPEGYEEITGYNYESWHYRYIGTAATSVEQDFFEGIQQQMLEYLHEYRDELEAWVAYGRGGGPDGR